MKSEIHQINKKKQNRKNIRMNSKSIYKYIKLLSSKSKKQKQNTDHIEMK